MSEQTEQEKQEQATPEAPAPAKPEEVKQEAPTPIAPVRPARGGRVFPFIIGLVLGAAAVGVLSYFFLYEPLMDAQNERDLAFKQIAATHQELTKAKDAVRVVAEVVRTLEEAGKKLGISALQPSTSPQGGSQPQPTAPEGQLKPPAAPEGGSQPQPTAPEGQLKPPAAPEGGSQPQPTAP